MFRGIVNCCSFVTIANGWPACEQWWSIGCSTVEYHVAVIMKCHWLTFLVSCNKICENAHNNHHRVTSSPAVH
uniref:Putative secreted protein n=1 Tax=Anopheles triannulatus TaxID=58253 RepID=A0A2M4B7N9_9DIPT